MNCSHFARILADFQELKLSPEEQSAVEVHLKTCSACRRLLDIARSDVDILPEDVRDELARSILDRTSGSVCARIESSLWDFVEGDLSMEDSQLIALHLDHCTDCRSVAGDLVVIQEALPTMAEIEPGESFTREVVDTTSRWRPYRSVLRTRFLGSYPSNRRGRAALHLPPPGQERGPSYYSDRLLAWWSRMVQRPNFSFEAAYLGTLVLFFAFSSLFLQFRNISINNISWAEIQPSTKYLISIWADAKAPVSKRLNEVASAVAMKKKAVSESLSKLAKDYQHESASALDKSVQSVKKWRRKQEVILLKFWTRLSYWMPQTKL